MTRMILISLMIICFGFGLLELFDGSLIRGIVWLGAGTICSIFMNRFKKPQKEVETTPLVSILEPETVEMIQQGKPLPRPSDLKLMPSEKLLWYDNAAQDYYGGKSGILYLTNRRILMKGKEFSFDHPLSMTKLKPTRNGFELTVNKRSMRFQSLTSQLLINVWNQRQNQQ